MSKLRNPNADTGLVSQYFDLCTDIEYRMQLVAGRLTGAHLFSSNSGPTLGGIMEPPSVYNTASQPASLASLLWTLGHNIWLQLRAASI